MKEISCDKKNTVSNICLTSTFLYFFIEFGVYLAEITVDAQGPLAIRQLASVLLKQYVQCHWSQQSDKYISPETTDAVRFDRIFTFYDLNLINAFFYNKQL